MRHWLRQPLLYASYENMNSNIHNGLIQLEPDLSRHSMSTNNPPLDKDFIQLDSAWPLAHAWAVDQMPCPAYCCATNGAIVHCNLAAVRVWGASPSDEEGLWHGFAKLSDMDGNDVAREDNPCAAAALGAYPAACEFLAIAQDGSPRRVVIHAKPVFGAHAVIVGVLCCLTDISEQQRLQKKIGEVGKARNEFLQMLAHELRNPLAPIMSAAGYLQHVRIDPSVTKMAGMMERQTRQLARFITDLLDASRVSCIRHLPVEPRSCTEDEVLELALDTVNPHIHARNQCLVIDRGSDGTALRCDPERVAQALSGVLLNASNFSPDGEALFLRITRNDTTLLLEVVDSGTGIAADDLMHIFDPFERGSVQSGRAPAGAGLGLTIARGVCEAHGGSIDVRSAGAGQGTAVSIALPVLALDAGNLRRGAAEDSA
jgi:signal transduction histidine kinase